MNRRTGPALLARPGPARPALNGFTERQGLGASGIDDQNDHVHDLAIVLASRKMTPAANTLLSTLNSRSMSILPARNTSWDGRGLV